MLCDCWLMDVPRTALITAFPPEWAALAHSIEAATEHRIKGLTILAGTLSDRPVVLMQSGISMVNAAMNMQMLIDRFAVDRILFSGIAGGVDPGLDVGDVIVPERWGQNFEVAFARESSAGYAPPSGIPGTTDLPGHGALFPRDVVIGDREHRWFAVDPEMLAIARRIAASVTLEQGALPHQPRVIVGGTGVSGSAFVDNAAYRDYLARVYAARVIDMESAAVAQVAFANTVPFIIFRSLSDLAGGDAGTNSMLTFMALAAGNSAHLVRAFVAALPIAAPAHR
jgi:adenosylhomocysteine nucleosidase